MRTPSSAAAAAAPIAFYDVTSDDGTLLRAWTNDPDRTSNGPTVLLCNGLGTSPWAWPALLRPDCGVRVVSWYHRGTGGSERPDNDRNISIKHFAEDALSVMDAFGIDRTVLLGWSVGVNTMFELAAEHPERVTGLFAVAGVPGDSLGGLLGPLHLPRPVARAIGAGWSRYLRLAGKALTPVTTRFPVSRWTIDALTRTHLVGPFDDPELAALALSEFLSTPIDWYFHLALRTADHSHMSLKRIRVPVLFVGGTFDLIAGARHMARAAGRITRGEYVELRASHFIPLEHPERVHQLLLDFIERVQDGRAGSRTR